MVAYQMRTFIIHFLTILFLQISIFPFLLGQVEHEIHLNSIRTSPFNKQSPEGMIGDSVFLEFVIDNVLERPQDVMFVSNRDLLTPLCVKHCANNKVAIYDTLKDNRIIDVYIHAKEFIAEEHAITYFDEDSLIESIDSLAAYGGTFEMPKIYLDSMSVSIGGNKVRVPKEAFSDLYNPNFCMNELFRQSVMAYPSMNGKYLYLYIYGGTGEDTYFAKLIFDKTSYIKKIVTEYADLSTFGAFRYGFIGY